MTVVDEVEQPLDLTAMFTPITIGDITLANRFVMPGMQRGWCSEGRPLPRLAAYYKRRIEGGASLVITESCAVDHYSSTQNSLFGRISDTTKDSWRACVDAVRGAGGHLFLQLWHEGAAGLGGPPATENSPPALSPSGLASSSRANGREASSAELAEIAEAFVRGAVLAKQIGASGVEVHGAHGFLLDQFLWPVTNRRADGYGGDDIRDRVRFPAEVVAAIRREVGEEFPISFRFSQWKEADYEARVADSPAELETMLSVLRGAGVDVFHASARRFWTPEWPESDLGVAGWAKSLTDARVIAVGSVGLDVDVMETFEGKVAQSTGLEAFREMRRRFLRGDFDLMSVGRGQISDPDWVRKVRDGEFAEIRTFRREHLGEVGTD